MIKLEEKPLFSILYSITGGKGHSIYIEIITAVHDYEEHPA